MKTKSTLHVNSENCSSLSHHQNKRKTKRCDKMSQSRVVLPVHCSVCVFIFFEQHSCYCCTGCTNSCQYETCIIYQVRVLVPQVVFRSTRESPNTQNRPSERESAQETAETSPPHCGPMTNPFFHCLSCSGCCCCRWCFQPAMWWPYVVDHLLRLNRGSEDVAVALYASTAGFLATALAAQVRACVRASVRVCTSVISCIRTCVVILRVYVIFLLF